MATTKTDLKSAAVSERDVKKATQATARPFDA